MEVLVFEDCKCVNKYKSVFRKYRRTEAVGYEFVAPLLLIDGLLFIKCVFNFIYSYFIILSFQ